MVCDPGFFDSVASKELSQDVSLLFATLAGRFISAAVKGLKAIVERNRDGVGAGQWTVASGGEGREMGNGSSGLAKERGGGADEDGERESHGA